MQNCVGLLPPFLRLKEIRLVEKLRINLLQIHKIGDVDRVRRFNADFLEVFVFHHDVTTLLELEAFYDLIGRHFLGIGLGDLFVFDRA